MRSSTSNSRQLALSAAIVLASVPLFFALGEVYMRLRYFGPDALTRFGEYVPASIGHPFCRVRRDAGTFTRLAASSEGMLVGRPFRTNSLGFRDKERSFEKSQGTFRIVVLGSSIGMGAGVAQEETYPAVLERLLNERGPRPYEVINLSMAGYNVDRMAETLERFGLRYQPDLILVEGQDYYHWSDFVRTAGLPKQAHFRFWDVVLRNPAAVFFFYQAIRNEFLFDPKKKLKEPDPRKARFLASIGESAFLSGAEIDGYLEKMRGLAEGRPLFMVDLSLSSQLVSAMGSVSDEDLVRNMAFRHGFRYVAVDAAKAGSRLEDRILYSGDRHPNPRMHRLIAESLRDALLSGETGR